MKNLLFNKKFTILTCMVFAMMFVFTSCGKEDVTDVNNVEAQEEAEIDIDNLPSKEIQLFDETGENSITLKVSTEDESLLELYSEKLFNLELRDKLDVENGNSNTDRIESIDDDERLHDLSIERTKVYIGIIDENVQNTDLAVGILLNESETVAFRAYNLETLYYSTSHWDGMTVKCTGRGIDGLSAYAYDARYTSWHPCYIESHHFSSRYFYSSGTQHFYRGYNECRLYVKVVHYHNYQIWAFRW